MTPAPDGRSFLALDPAAMSQKDLYKLLIGSVVPRPIAFVSTVSPAGVANLAPFSFFNAVCSSPPSLLFTTTRRASDNAKKDTLLNIEATGEFVVNVVTEDIALPMNQCSAEYPREVSEFTASGLTPVASVRVQPPRVAESPINMECRLLQLVEIGDGGPGSGTVIIGEIVWYHVREDVYDHGRILTERLRPVARLAGSSYCPVRDVFDIPRPVVPGEEPRG